MPRQTALRRRRRWRWPPPMPTAVPSLRMVLLRGHAADGFRFFTGYDSRKAAELDRQPAGRPALPLAAAGRQIRIEGRVHGCARRGVGRLLHQPPGREPAGRVGQHQGTVIRVREALDEAMAAASDRFGRASAAPDPLGRLPRAAASLRVLAARRTPAARPFPLHAEGGGWVIERLAP